MGTKGTVQTLNGLGVLVVPNYYTLKERELEKISEIIKTCLSFER